MRTILIPLFLTLLISSLYSDGIVDASEYSESMSLKKAELFWDIEGDTFKIAIEAETKGWLAVGLGSSRMDGSVMFFGYSKDGEAFLEEHLGRGHSHSAVDNERQFDFEVTELGGRTSIEIIVSKSDFISAGQSELAIIAAYGARDNFTSMHRYRDTAVIKF
jgi:hypothetical protein